MFLGDLFVVNRLIPTPQGVNPVGRNALPAPKRRAFIPLSDSSARKYKSSLLYFTRSTSPVKVVIIKIIQDFISHGVHSIVKKRTISCMTTTTHRFAGGRCSLARMQSCLLEIDFEFLAEREGELGSES